MVSCPHGLPGEERSIDSGKWTIAARYGHLAGPQSGSVEIEIVEPGSK